MSDVYLVIANIYAPLVLVLSGIGCAILVLIGFLDALGEILG